MNNAKREHYNPERKTPYRKEKQENNWRNKSVRRKLINTKHQYVR